jgi:hypothetical protein
MIDMTTMQRPVKTQKGYTETVTVRIGRETNIPQRALDKFLQQEDVLPADKKAYVTEACRQQGKYAEANAIYHAIGIMKETAEKHLRVATDTATERLEGITHVCALATANTSWAFFFNYGPENESDYIKPTYYIPGDYIGAILEYVQAVNLKKKTDDVYMLIYRIKTGFDGGGWSVQSVWEGEMEARLVMARMPRLQVITEACTKAMKLCLEIELREEAEKCIEIIDTHKKDELARWEATPLKESGIIEVVKTEIETVIGKLRAMVDNWPNTPA